MKIIVIRAFYVAGTPEPYLPGAVVECADGFAREMIHMGKAAPADAMPPASPMTARGTAALVPGAPQLDIDDSHAPLESRRKKGT